MGVNVLDRIYKAIDMAGGVTDIVIFTESFKAYGNVVKDDKDGLKDILTLKNATICHHFDECSCNIEKPYLNTPLLRLGAGIILRFCRK